MLIVRVATICYDEQTKRVARRLWEISAGTEPRGGAWHGGALLRVLPSSIAVRRDAWINQRAPHIPRFTGGGWSGWGGFLSSLIKTASIRVPVFVAGREALAPATPRGVDLLAGGAQSGPTGSAGWFIDRFARSRAVLVGALLVRRVPGAGLHHAPLGLWRALSAGGHHGRQLGFPTPWLLDE